MKRAMSKKLTTTEIACAVSEAMTLDVTMMMTVANSFSCLRDQQKCAALEVSYSSISMSCL